ncbi:MAG: alpha/beta hydrolase [Candidatus Marinimicrobia bacterium]|nr:alpha/beta hydrolase [Candidatus Neomarinimicrobiota bacterium]
MISCESQYEEFPTEIKHLEGMSSYMIQTDRLNTHLLMSGSTKGTPVIFLHGNFTAATYWEENMVNLPEEFWAIAPDLRGYGWSEDKAIDATRGFSDWSDDLQALYLALNIEKAHIVGWSLGGGVVYRFMADHPEMVLSATLVSPVSPYGFGGSKGLGGTSCYEDYAGSGGGVVNPEFIQLIKAGDKGVESQNSPRNVINGFYFKPPFKAAREEEFLTASLKQSTGDDRYPGDFVASENWPNVAPGVWGPINAGAPKYVADDAQALINLPVKPPILWVRGSDDMIVSDISLFDFGALGQLGYVPGWPGDEVFPPQPMVGQTRNALEQYAAHGGTFTEVVMENTAHAPQIEKPDEFGTTFLGFIRGE